MSDCITAIIAAVIIAALLGDGNGCNSNRRCRSRNDRCDLSCGCDN